MDQFRRSYYEIVFKNLYLEKDGNEFQDFFSEIMEKCHPGDFQRVRPWGNTGDRKNDGYLRSERTLFQVYAPNEMSASDAVAKINEDFHGALPYWETYFDTWVFVHNSKDGLGPAIVAKLNDHPNPTYEDEIASAFKNEYKTYKMLGVDPDTIFCKLQEFTGGSERGTPADEAAVLAVLAYLFEQCDIFERSPEEVPL